MIVANRGVYGIAFDEGEIRKDMEAINAAKKPRRADKGA